jgi:hypothetical protein
VKYLFPAAKALQDRVLGNSEIIFEKGVDLSGGTLLP